MRKLRRGLVALSGGVACLMLIAMVVVMFLAIVMRQFGVLLEGSGEIATFAMVWLAFLGLPAVYSAGLHIRVETVFSRLPARAQRGLNIWCVAVAMVVCSAFVYYTSLLVWDSYKFGDTSIGLLVIPLWIPQLSLPIGLGLLFLALLDDLLVLIDGGSASFEKDAHEEMSHAE